MAGNPDRTTTRRGTGACWTHLGIITTLGGIAAAAIHFAFIDAARTLGAQLAYPVLALVISGALTMLGADCASRWMRRHRALQASTGTDHSPKEDRLELGRALTFKVTGPGASSLLAGYGKSAWSPDRSDQIARLR